MNRKIYLKLKQIAECIYNGINNKSISNINGVYNGEFGILLFLYYYSQYSQDLKFLKITDKYTDQLLDQLGSKKEIHTFCSGLSGILYLFEFLRNNDFVDIYMEDIGDVFDNFILKNTDLDIQKQYFDFMHGALGAGLYFLKRKTHPEEISNLIDYLYETAEKDKIHETFCWKSSLGVSGEIGYNIALSHGISSIVLFLCRVSMNGFSHPSLSELLTGAVNYLLSQEIDIEIYGSYFPSQSKEKIIRGRLAWCYGDLGVAYAIWYAGKIMENNSWIKKGLEVFTYSTKRLSPKDNMVMDAGICHGSSGVAMFFYRIYLETGDKIYKEAGEHWIKRTLDLAHFKDGLAGYKTYNKEMDTNPDYSLLTGIAGIGMVLISYLSSDEQKWDELFLLS